MGKQPLGLNVAKNAITAIILTDEVGNTGVIRRCTNQCTPEAEADNQNFKGRKEAGEVEVKIKKAKKWT